MLIQKHTMETTVASKNTWKIIWFKWTIWHFDIHCTRPL